MKNIQIKFCKEKGEKLLTFFCVVLTLMFFSCIENEEKIYGIDDEPPAAIGFSDEEITVTEGTDETSELLSINTSKRLFNNVTFDLVVLEGDASGITTTDEDGNASSSFTINRDEKTVSFKFIIADDTEFKDDRIVKFGISNLRGRGVFIPEESESIGGGENSLNIELILNVIEDDEY